MMSEQAVTDGMRLVREYWGYYPNIVLRNRKRIFAAGSTIPFGVSLANYDLSMVDVREGTSHYRSVMVRRWKDTGCSQMYLKIYTDGRVVLRGVY